MKIVNPIVMQRVPMSLLESGGQKERYVFRGRFGTAPSYQTAEEPTHEEVDRFVKGILGLNADE